MLDETALAGLAQSDLLVEVHDCYRPGLSERLTQRLSPGHAVDCLRRRDMAMRLPESSAHWSDLDRALAVCEWRVGPTPWLWAQSRQQRSIAKQVVSPAI